MDELLQTVEKSELFWDFDLISPDVKEKVFHVFEEKMKVLTGNNTDWPAVEETALVSFLKERKIELYYEVKVSIQLIQHLSSLLPEDQNSLLSELLQLKSSALNKEAFDKFKNFVIECARQDEILQEKLFIEFDRNLLRVIHILGQKNLISSGIEKLELLDELFKSETEEIYQIYSKYRGKFIGLFCLTFSCPLITRPTLIDYFMKIVRKPELIESHFEKKNDRQLRKTVNRSLSRTVLAKNGKRQESASQETAQSHQAKIKLPDSLEKKNREASERLQFQIDTEGFTNRYLLSNSWISGILKDAVHGYKELYPITAEIYGIFLRFEKNNEIFQNFNEKQQDTLRELHNRKGEKFKSLLEFFQFIAEKEPELFLPENKAEGHQIRNGLTILGLQKKPVRDKEGIHVKLARLT
ncbi:MAG: hypothetical protein HQM13_00995 [SAR324 cluster bacterium]|nr:hypothetical protein [SAR324 cluster bacterium]